MFPQQVFLQLEIFAIHHFLLIYINFILGKHRHEIKITNEWMNECIQFLIRYRYLFLFDIISNKCKGCFIFVNLVSVYESDCLYLDHVHIITCISSGGNLPLKLLVLIPAATFEFSTKFLTLFITQSSLLIDSPPQG